MALSFSSQDMPSSLFTSSVAFLWTLSRVLTSFLYYKAQNCTQYSGWGCTNAEYTGRTNAFDHLAMVYAAASWLPGHAAGSCWASCHEHSQILSAELLSNHSSLSLWLCLALLHPRCRTGHFTSLNFMPLLITQCCDLSTSICKVSYPVKVSTAPPTWVSSAKLLRMHFTPPFRFLTKIMNLS